MTFTFRAAADHGWLAFASGPLLLAVEPQDEAFVASAWASLRSASAFQTTLNLLTLNGIAATPSFALVEWIAGGTARVIVRGAATLHLTGAVGAQELSGLESATWLERSVEAVVAVSFEVPGVQVVGLGLPVESGVALVGSIQSVGDAPARPAPAIRPAPLSAAAPPPPPAPAAAAPAPVVAAPVPSPAHVAPAVPATAQSDAIDHILHDGETVVIDEIVKLRGQARKEAQELHDGETVMLSDDAKLQARKQRGSAAAAPPAPPPPPTIVLVIAPTGLREPVTQPILMGRSPNVTQVSGQPMPKLVTVGTIDQDISRNHAQFALAGDSLVVTDLHSRNGTTIQLPGQPAQKLRAGEPTTIIVGTVVDFGGGVTVTVEEES